MKLPIRIDLRHLTQAHIDEALPFAGECKYTSPCIIGTLMTPEQREYIDSYHHGAGVLRLERAELVNFPEGQSRTARQLQRLFDNMLAGRGGIATDEELEAHKQAFQRAAQPWIDATPPKEEP